MASSAEHMSIEIQSSRLPRREDPRAGARAHSVSRGGGGGTELSHRPAHQQGPVCMLIVCKDSHILSTICVGGLGSRSIVVCVEAARAPSVALNHACPAVRMKQIAAPNRRSRADIVGNNITPPILQQHCPISSSSSNLYNLSPTAST